MVRFEEGVGVCVEEGIDELVVVVEFAGEEVDWAETWRRREEKRRDRKRRGLIVGGREKERGPGEGEAKSGQVSRHGEACV